MASSSRPHDHSWAPVRTLLCSIGFFTFIAVASVARGFNGSLPGFCLFTEIAGLPCPGCGVTRGLLELVSGNFVRSLQHTPAALAIFVFFAATTLIAIAEGAHRLRPDLAARTRRSADRILAMTLLTIWFVRVLLPNAL